MKRETKFRAWHRKEKLMYWFDLMWGNFSQGGGYIGMAPFGQPDTNKNYKDNLRLVDPYECEIMQFTGLPDKNGKEIYEGDIVRQKFPYDSEDLSNENSIEIGTVVFNLGQFEINNYPLYICVDFDAEIIGNIHENPELLNQ